MLGEAPRPQEAPPAVAIAMPRPKLSPDELRRHRVSIYLSPAELSELRRRAESAQLSLPVYLRDRALRTVEPSAEPRRLAAAEFRELSRIGGNLNQVARALNRNRSAPDFRRSDIERLRALISLVMPKAED